MTEFIKLLSTRMLKNLQKNNKIILILILLYLLYFFLMPKIGHTDIKFWVSWSIYIFNNGLSKIYQSNTDYLPLFHYMLWIYAKTQGSIEAIVKNIYIIKSLVLIFDFIAGIVLIKILQIRNSNNQEVFFLSLFYFLNTFILYNTIFWGQVDGIMACFVFTSFYFVFKKKVIQSIIFIILALNFKLQAIVFVPFIGLLLLPEFVRQYTIKKALMWFSTLVFIEFLILLPFILHGNFERMWIVVTNSMGKFPVVSINAYNIWYLIIPENQIKISSLNKFLGITYDTWGLIMFCNASFIALLPLLIDCFKSLKEKSSIHLPIDKLLIIGSLIPLCFFYFNTQMHERYSHPAFIFLITYSIMQNKLWIGCVGSIIYFLNLEKVLRVFQLQNYGTLIFNPILISLLYLMIIITLYLYLYNKKLPKPNINWIRRSL